MQSTGEYCKCGGKAGYMMTNGELVCQACGGVSPKARVTDSGIVKLGDHALTCPRCGTVIQEARLELKIGAEPENKMAEAPETKRRGFRKLRR